MPRYSFYFILLLLFLLLLLQDPCWDKTEIKEELKDEVPLEEDEEHEDRLMHMNMRTQTSAYKYVWTRVTIYPLQEKRTFMIYQP